MVGGECKTGASGTSIETGGLSVSGAHQLVGFAIEVTVRTIILVGGEA
jgi:hypothetical protein